MPYGARSRQEAPLAVLLGAAFDAAVSALHAELPRLGFADIRPVHCTNVFRLIDPEGTRPGVLAARAGVTPQAMAQFVGYLEERGYLRRSTDPEDGRAHVVRLTPQGVRASEAAIEAFRVIEQRWTSRMSDDQASALRQALHVIIGQELGTD